VETTPLYSRYFTPAEANALLPGLQRSLVEIASYVQEARSISTKAGRLASEPERQHAQQRLDGLRDEVERRLEQIQEAGVEVKGLQPALLDFPALRNGQIVYLCWREGEDQVAWWHPLHTGVSGRQPVTQLGLWEWCN